MPRVEGFPTLSVLVCDPEVLPAGISRVAQAHSEKEAAVR